MPKRRSRKSGQQHTERIGQKRYDQLRKQERRYKGAATLLKALPLETIPAILQTLAITQEVGKQNVQIHRSRTGGLRHIGGFIPTGLSDPMTPCRRRAQRKAVLLAKGQVNRPGGAPGPYKSRDMSRCK